MQRRENLPRGFERLESGSLRVRLRLKGHPTFSMVFPIFSSSTEGRRAQLADAKAWAESTRRAMLAGQHVSSDAGKRVTLGESIKRYQREELANKGGDRSVEGYRIGMILKDPVSKLHLLKVRKVDVVAFRDRLIDQAWVKSIDRARQQAERANLKDRVRNLDQLKKLRIARARVDDEEELAEMDTRIASIIEVEEVKGPARTTVSNTLQLISRAIKFASQTIEGVPDVSGISMPRSSPGRERRLEDGEEAAILKAAGAIDSLFPSLIRFAIDTTLRRERILSFGEDNLVGVGRGRRSIVFPRETRIRNKRTGVVPLTRELIDIIEAAKGSRPCSSCEARSPVFPITKDQLTSWWGRMLASTGISNLHFHDLRHEGTSRLFERGLSFIEVMSITGHSTTEMLDRYSHYSSAVVGEKLERGQNIDWLLREIELLMAQYRALGGEKNRLAAALA